MESRCFFTSTVYYIEGIPGAEALAAQKILATILRFNLKREYYELCGFERARMSLVLLSPNSLLLNDPWDK